MYYIIFRKSYFIQRKQTEEKSIRLAEELEKVRAAARGKTRDVKIFPYLIIYSQIKKKRSLIM